MCCRAVDKRVIISFRLILFQRFSCHDDSFLWYQDRFSVNHLRKPTAWVSGNPKLLVHWAFVLASLDTTCCGTYMCMYSWGGGGGPIKIALVGNLFTPFYFFCRVPRVSSLPNLQCRLKIFPICLNELSCPARLSFFKGFSSCSARPSSLQRGEEGPSNSMSSPWTLPSRPTHVGQVSWLYFHYF